MHVRKAMLIAAAVASIAAPASAATYMVNYTATSGGPLPTTAAFRLMTSNTLNLAGGYDILTASGSFTVNGVTTLVTGLAPINPPGFNTDNVYFNANPIFTGNGLGVAYAGGFGNLWGNGPSNYSFFISNDGGTYPVGTDGFAVAAQVPEPATWALLIVGFGMIGVAARRRKALLAN